MISVIYLWSLIFPAQEKGKLCSKIGDDLDVTKCNYGKHYEGIFRWCDCRNVLGNGPHCEIKKQFTNTHVQVIFAIFPDHFDSWKKNLETEFSKEKITIMDETKYYVKGSVNNNIYFHLQFFPKISDKKYILTPRSNLEMIEKIFSKEAEIKNVSTEDERSKSEETKVVKSYSIYIYSTWTLAVILTLVILGLLLKIFLKKFICRPKVNRLRSIPKLGTVEEREFFEGFSDNSNAKESRTSIPELGIVEGHEFLEGFSENSNAKESRTSIPELGIVEGHEFLEVFSDNSNAKESRTNSQILFDVLNENDKIQTTQSHFPLIMI